MLPVLIVILTGIVVLVTDLIITDWLSRRPLMWLASFGLLIGLASCGAVYAGGYVGKTAFGGFLVVDGFVLFSTAGLMLMAAGNELMSIYLALEVTSLGLAFLAAWNKRDAIAGQGW